MVMLSDLQATRTFVGRNDDEYLARMVKRRAGGIAEVGGSLF
jgi:hypothetical protein